MASVNEQIVPYLLAGETLAAVATMRRQNTELQKGVAVGGMIGMAIVRSRQQKVLQASRLLADRIGFPEQTYVAVTSRRLILFANDRRRWNGIGEPIVAFAPQHIVSATPVMRTLNDSRVILEFVDGSSATLDWRKRKEISSWSAALAEFLRGRPAPVVDEQAAWLAGVPF